MNSFKVVKILFFSQPPKKPANGGIMKERKILSSTTENGRKPKSRLPEKENTLQSDGMLCNTKT